MSHKYSAISLSWSPLVPFKAAQLMQMAKNGIELKTMETELCSVTCVNVQFIMQGQAVL